MEGFLQALTNLDLIYFVALFLGVIAGYVIGALPGFTATMGVAIFVPFSYRMNVTVAFGFLIALYCSAVFAGSIPAILIRTPGTPAAICTINDGYPMAKKGEAGKALGLACLASIIGGVFSALVLFFVAGGIADFALKFGPQEYFALAALGLSMVIGMSSDNLVKGFISMAIGLLITVIGMDVMSGMPRFIFGRFELMSGIQELPVMIGVFALSEVFVGLTGSGVESVPKQKVTNLFSGLKDLAQNKWLLLKCSVIGTFLGALPGVGATTAAIIGYNEARKSSKHPELMGTGQPEGVIGPECANNAVTGGALIPLLALGIPGDPVTAILLGALMIQGLRPGPELFATRPDVISGIYISVLLSYVAILIFSTFSIKYIAKLLNIKQSILSAFVLVFCIIGTYALQNSYFDVYVAIAFGIIGYIMRKNDYSLGPLTLALVLGRMIEEKLGLSLVLSQNNWSTFFTRPISASLLGFTFIFIFFTILRMIKDKRKKK